MSYSYPFYVTCELTNPVLKEKEGQAYWCAGQGLVDEMDALIQELVTVFSQKSQHENALRNFLRNCATRAVVGKQVSTFARVCDYLEQYNVFGACLSVSLLPLSVSDGSQASDMFFDVLNRLPKEHLRNRLVAAATFYEIARLGNVAQAQKLLPFVRVKEAQSDYLREACLHQNHALVQFLLPLSNVESALKYLKARKKQNKAQLEPLQRFVEAKQLHKDLHQKLSSSVAGKSPRKQPKL